MQKTMGCILHSPHLLLPGLFIDVFLFLMSPCLPLWHRFKVSHIIRESRASLLCLWGFPSRLYNDLPVGLFWFWLHSLLANSAQLWPGSSPNRTHFVLDSVFGTSCSCTTPAADSFVLLTAGFFFLHHPLFFPPLLPPSLICFSDPAVPSFRLCAFHCLSFCLISIDIFSSFRLKHFPPPLSAEEAVSAVMYEGSWRPPASQQSVWRVSNSAIGYWLFTQLRRWINTNCHTCCSAW